MPGKAAFRVAFDLDLGTLTPKPLNPETPKPLNPKTLNPGLAMRVSGLGVPLQRFRAPVLGGS